MSVLKVSVAIFCMLCSICFGYDDSQTHVSTVGNISLKRSGRDVEDQACDCGPNSKECHFQEGEKICDCEYKYRQVNGFCEPFCEKNYQCNNGAPCLNESCRCFKGTRGDFCKTVDECEGEKGIFKCGDPEEVFCAFDRETHEIVCKCRIYEYIYYPPTRTCIECDCDEKYGSCILEEGVKKCLCNKDAATKTQWYFSGISERCYPCKCEGNSSGCYFDKDTTEKICNCTEGTVQQPGHDWGAVTCDVCSCGDHGKCYYRGIFKNCICDEGYKPFVNSDRTDVYCEKCNCGKNGECSFRKQKKQCQCRPKYSEREGICVACQCYADEEIVDCFFEGKIQHCLCPEGYKNGTFFCEDINECNVSRGICPEQTVCVNTMGSYECKCEEGYKASESDNDPEDDLTCDDIDECEDESMCPRVHTKCSNLPGTYECECETGFVPIIDDNPKAKGCETKKSTWKTTVTVICVSSAFVATVIGIIIFKKKKKKSHKHTASVDAMLQDLK